MKNILVVISLLALVSTGVFLYSSNKNQLRVAEDDDETPMISEEQCGCHDVTFTSWKTCTYKANIGKCDDLPVNKRSECYAASAAVVKYVWPEVTKDCDCNKFWRYYELADANQNINWNNYYRKCFTQTGLYKAASKSSYYLNNIFLPQYWHCAGIKA